MRLALVTETFPPEINGVAQTLGRWVETFTARGHAVDLIRPRRPGERLAEDGVEYFAVPFYPQVRLGLALPRQLQLRLRKFRAQLVHIATEGPLGLAALWAAQRLKLPIASSFHTNFDAYMTHYGLRGLEWTGRAYLRWFHNQCGLTLVPSKETKSWLEQQRFQRVAVWSRGVDGELFNPKHRSSELRAALGLAESDVLLLYVGRLAAEKNLDLLLTSFRELRTRLVAAHPKVKLALVGDGPYLESLRGRLEPDLYLAGVQRGLALSSWYASADGFAFPSKTETFGNVILEAQASGLAVVTCDYPAMRERITSGVDGLLLKTDAEWPPALARLCQEPTWREQLAQAARRTAERQTWGPIFDELEGRYERLIAST